VDFSTNIEALREPLQRLHAEIRDAVVSASEQAERAQSGELAGIADDSPGDTIYAVDKISEARLVAFIEQEIACHTGVVLIAEGVEGGKIVLPRGTLEEDAVWRIIVDPIDGTRGIMYQKRSAWVLTGVARNRGPETNLQDIELALQTEIPLNKQHLSDMAWAMRGQGAHATRYNRLTGEIWPIEPRPSAASTIEHGYAEVVRYFPGAREELSAIDDEIVFEAVGPILPGKSRCFEDQYASSGGQLYELMCGHDRFIADLRPLMEKFLAAKGLALGLCCHPYDICTQLIAQERSVIVCNPAGEPLRSLLAVEPNIAWVGYANGGIRRQIEPVLQAALARRGLL
jgi:hypothetical protein